MKPSSATFQPFFFVQMTDPQLGMTTYNEDFEAETRLWQAAIAHANRLRPDFVLISGDLVNVPGDPEQTRQARNLLAEFEPELPVYLAAGNHDVGDHPTAADLASYRAQFGDDWYAFDRHDVRFVVLNSNLIHRGQAVPDEAARQHAWLEKELAEADGRWTHVVVVLHHPLFLEQPDEPAQYFNIPPEPRAQLLQMLHDHGVRHVFAGHLHENRLARDGDLEMVTTGPVGLPLGTDPSGFRVIEVHADRITHQYVGLMDVPDQVPLG